MVKVLLSTERLIDYFGWSLCLSALCVLCDCLEPICCHSIVYNIQLPQTVRVCCLVDRCHDCYLMIFPLAIFESLFSFSCTVRLLVTHFFFVTHDIHYLFSVQFELNNSTCLLSESELMQRMCSLITGSPWRIH